MHEPSSDPEQMNGTDVPELLARVKAMRGANTERLPKKTLESLAHCIYKHGMSGHEALQNEHLLDPDGNALTEDATMEGIIRSLEHVQPKSDSLKRRASTRASSRLSKRQKTRISNSIDALPSRPQATRSRRRRHDKQPMNSEGTNVETAVHRNESQRTAVGNRGTAAGDGNAPSTNNADYSNNDAPAAASAHNNHNTAAAAESDDQRNAAGTDAMNYANNNATGADAHNHTAAPSIQASDGVTDMLAHAQLRLLMCCLVPPTRVYTTILLPIM